MASNRIVRALWLCAAVGVVTAPGHAGYVDIGGGWRASWDDSLDGLVDIFSVGVVGDAVFIEKTAEFTDGPVNGVYAPVDIVFTQTSPNAVGSIVIDDEIITNSSGEDWLDFHMELIGDAATFDDVATANSGGPGPIGFSINPFTDAVFSSDLKRLDISGGVVPDGHSWFPGVAGGQLWIDVVTGSGVTFTLRETPTIPTPGTLALLAISGLVLIPRRPVRL